MEDEVGGPLQALEFGEGGGFIALAGLFRPSNQTTLCLCNGNCLADSSPRQRNSLTVPYSSSGPRVESPGLQKYLYAGKPSPMNGSLGKFKYHLGYSR